MIGSPVKMYKTPARVTAAPQYGQHTQEIFHNLLGVPAEGFPELCAQGVIA